MPKVLVVDDLATDRCLVGGILESDSILEVRFASNGAEALRKIRRGQSGIGILAKGRLTEAVSDNP